jgi:hypothetical protein
VGDQVQGEDLGLLGGGLSTIKASSCPWENPGIAVFATLTLPDIILFNYKGISLGGKYHGH